MNCTVHSLVIGSLCSGLFLSSCTSTKNMRTQVESKNSIIRRLRSDSTSLAQKVDSLSKLLNEKTVAINALQKNVNQLSLDKDKKVASRKKVETENYDKVSLYVYNITKYVDWHPSQEEENFVIGVIGNDDIYQEMVDQFKGKKISNKPVIVTKMNSLKEIGSANLYFVSTTRINYLTEVYKRMSKNHALVVSDIHYSTDGVHINFFTDGDTLRFEMNDEQIKKSKLTVSSSLKHLQHK